MKEAKWVVDSDWTPQKHVWVLEVVILVPCQYWIAKQLENKFICLASSVPDLLHPKINSSAVIQETLTSTDSASCGTASGLNRWKCSSVWKALGVGNFLPFTLHFEVVVWGGNWRKVQWNGEWLFIIAGLARPWQMGSWRKGLSQLCSASSWCRILLC